MYYNWCGGSFEGIKEIASILREPGAVAVVPTETVYGLVGRVNDPLCREKIYELKHRDPAKHLGWRHNFSEWERSCMSLPAWRSGKER